MSNERRKNQRAANRVIVQINTPGSVIPKIGCISDLSFEGLSFDSEDDLDTHLPILLTFSLPLEAEAEVVNVRKVGNKKRYGVRFVKFEEAAQGHLEKFISRRISKKI